MLYSKNGSIPKPQTDGTEGWVEVEEPPVAPDGSFEVVWWSPPGWVVRPNKPIKEGSDFSWSQSEERWVEHVIDGFVAPLEITEPAAEIAPTVDVSTTVEVIPEETNTPLEVVVEVPVAEVTIDVGTASATPTI